MKRKLSFVAVALLLVMAFGTMAVFAATSYASINSTTVKTATGNLAYANTAGQATGSNHSSSGSSMSVHLRKNSPDTMVSGSSVSVPKGTTRSGSVVTVPAAGWYYVRLSYSATPCYGDAFGDFS